MITQTLKWVDGCLEIIDQRLLPMEFVKLRCTDVEQVYDAIKTLAVRGAPAIGVTGAYGLVLAIQKIGAGLEQAISVLVDVGLFSSMEEFSAIPAFSFVQ